MSLDEEAADELPADEDEDVDVDVEGLEARRRRNPGRRRVARMGQCGIWGTVWLKCHCGRKGTLLQNWDSVAKA